MKMSSCGPDIIDAGPDMAPRLLIAYLYLTVDVFVDLHQLFGEYYECSLSLKFLSCTPTFRFVIVVIG